MNETKIDTEALSQQMEKLIKIKEKLTTILDDIKKETSGLKDYWESKTSESVFSNFEEMYKGYQTQLNNLNNDIEFLKATINNYKEQEKKANMQIDEHIAV